VALAQSGFAHAVATLGTACTADHVSKLFRFTDQVVFSFDGDAAGRRAAARALEAALPHAADHRSVRFLFLPPEHDPDSFVRERGAAAFEQAVADAVPLSRQLLEHSAQDCDLDSAEGRARMLTQARPLWEALPDGALRAQLLDDLAQRGRMAVHDLARLWGRPEAASRRARRPVAPGGPGPVALPAALRHAMPSPANKIAAALLADSHLWQGLPAGDRELLMGLETWHGQAMHWLDRHLVNHGPQPWPALRQDLDAQECAGWAEKARALVDGAEVPVAYGEAELQQLMKNLALFLQQPRTDSVKRAVMQQQNRL
jgi:DNA primase